MSGMELLTAIFSIVQGIVTNIMSHSGMAGGTVTELPSEIVDKIEAVGMLESIPLWIVTLLGSLLITVLSFVMILTVYGRMFKLYMYTAIAPIPLATFAGEPTQSVGKNFIRSYAGVCLEGAIIALACIIFSPSRRLSSMQEKYRFSDLNTSRFGYSSSDLMTAHANCSAVMPW